jgi:hypothetical protein
VNIRGAVNPHVRIEDYVCIKHIAAVSPPDHIPDNVEAAFKEGATCFAMECYNAAGTMFRLCIDMATRSKLPENDINSLNARIKRDLGLRLPWLFDNGFLPRELRELSSCVREDGNDGAHRGTLKKEDAEDLLDFTSALLERIYTEPEKLNIAKARREARRSSETKK